MNTAQAERARRASINEWKRSPEFVLEQSRGGPVELMDGDQIAAVVLSPSEYERMRQRDVSLAEALDEWRKEFGDQLDEEDAAVLTGGR